jgi:hypothetical protein
MLNTSINQTNKPFIVRIDGEIDKQLTKTGPTIKDHFNGFKGEIRLQVEMAVYDILHGTEYRTIRNALIKEKRNREWEARHGLVRVKD